MSQIYPQESPEDFSVQAIVDEQFCSEMPSTFTVWKKSLLFSGEGFTVFNSNGDLVFRMDTYATNPNDELLLMDAHGKALLTLRRKLPSLHQRWEGFLGDKLERKKPLFTVRKSSILPSNKCVVEVFMNCGFFFKPCADYQIEGSFSQRCCTIYTTAPRVAAAEVKRKFGAGGTVLGKDVFSLCVGRGFDQAFIMGVIIVLDHIFPSDVNEDDDPVKMVSKGSHKAQTHGEEEDQEPLQVQDDSTSRSLQ